MRFVFYRVFVGSTNTNPNIQTVTVKKEPEEISQQEHTQQIHIQQPQTQTIAVSVAPNPSSTHTIETSSTSGSQSQHILNSDGSTSLQIAQVQNLPSTHQLTLSNLNQVNQKNNNIEYLYVRCKQTNYVFDNFYFM